MNIGNNTTLGKIKVVMLKGEKGDTGEVSEAELNSRIAEVEDAINEEIGDLTSIVNENFVTPEMYGAVGDGNTDDSAAIQEAIETGKRVCFGKGKTYYIGQTIEIVGGCDIDFNGAKLKLAKGFHFSAPETSLGSGTYVAGSTTVNIATNDNSGIYRIITTTPSTLPDTDSELSQILFYKDNSAQYNLGFSSAYRNGKLEASFPASITGQQYFYPYTQVTIKNIGDIIPENTDDYFDAFLIKGCYVNIEDCNANDYGGLTLFELQYCKVEISRCMFYSSDRPLRPNDTNYYYAISIEACSYWTIRDVTAANAWHSVTTGANLGVSQNGLIERCVFRGVRSARDNNSLAYAYVEHKNTISTKIIDCSIEGCVICSGKVIRTYVGQYFGVWSARFNIYKRDTEYQNCTFSNQSPTTLVSYLGMSIEHDHYNGNITFDNCIFENPVTGFFNPFVNPDSLGAKINGGVLMFNNCDILKSTANYPLIRGESDLNVKQYAIFSTCYVNNCKSIYGTFASGYNAENDSPIAGNMGGMSFNCTESTFWRETSGTFNIAFGNVSLYNCKIFASPINHNSSNSNIVCYNCIKKDNALNQQESQYGCRARAWAGTGAADSYGVFKYESLTDVTITPVDKTPTYT